jgi:hypothetical protein
MGPKTEKTPAKKFLQPEQPGKEAKRLTAFN